MSISSLPVAKFQFPWAREEERDPRDQKQIVALTAALQASLARETASRQANAELLQRQHTLVLEFEHRFANGLQWITTLKVGPRPRMRRRNWQLRLVVLRHLAACIVGFTCSIVRKLSNSTNISDFCAATSQTFCSKMPRTTIGLR